MPHSAEIRAHNPLGLVPVLIHRPNALYAPKRSTVLYESNAIRRYVDDALYLIARQRHAHAQATGQAHASSELAGLLTPPLDTTDSQRLLATSAQRATVDQIVSLASTTIFTALEARLIKPRQALEHNGADEATVSVAVEEGLDDAQRVLGLLEGFLSSDGEGGQRQGKWLVGDALSWADLYVYPILADLKSIPEVSCGRNRQLAHTGHTLTLHVHTHPPHCLHYTGPQAPRHDAPPPGLGRPRGGHPHCTRNRPGYRGGPQAERQGRQGVDVAQEWTGTQRVEEVLAGTAYTDSRRIDRTEVRLAWRAYMIWMGNMTRLRTI